jgi:hypothetical protein
MAQLLESFDGLDAFDLGVARIDEANRSFEPGGAEISQDRASRRTLPRAPTHNRDRPRRKQLVETVGRHRSNRPSGMRRTAEGQWRVFAIDAPRCLLG